MSKRSRSGSPPVDNKHILEMLIKLERRMDSIEKQNTKRSRRSPSSDSDSSLRRHSSRRKHHRYDASDGWSKRITNEEQDGPCESDPEHENTSASPSGDASPLIEDILSALSDEIGIAESYGPPIHQQVADEWLPILTSGLECEQRNELILKYPSPDNSRCFDAPKLNQIIRQVVNDSVIKRDERLSNNQVQIGVALSAIASVISELMGKQEEGDDNKAIIERLNDAGRLLSDLHHSQSVTRRALASLNLRDSKDFLLQCISDEWLFGKDLEKRIKLDKSNQVKAVKPTSKKFYKTKNPFERFRGTIQNRQHQQRASFNKGQKPNRPRRQERLIIRSPYINGIGN